MGACQGTERTDRSPDFGLVPPLTTRYLGRVGNSLTYLSDLFNWGKGDIDGLIELRLKNDSVL